jgi:cytochrome P450
MLFSEGAVGEVREKIWVAVLGSLLLVLLRRLLFVGTRPWTKEYPPGPMALPFIGNLHQFPKKDMHLAYQKWAKEYGPIFSLKLGQQTLIVLASGEMIQKVVDKRSANYSDRPATYIRDLYENTHVIFRGYDDIWRLDRRLYHANLNMKAAQTYIPYQSVETLQLCIDLLKSPQLFFGHIRRTTASVASSLSYGFRISTTDSPIMAQMFKNGEYLFDLTARSKFLDWYPALRPLFRLVPTGLRPLASEAALHLKDEKEHFAKLYKNAVSSGMPSFSADIAASQKAWEGTTNGELLDDQTAAFTAGVAFEAGADTTKNTLIAFVQAMALFPEVVVKAHEELDRVVGDGSIPTVDDIKSLPYIRGIVKETLRWFPTTVSAALPHAATADDTIDGYDIPAGASILLAVWTVHNDPTVFPDPRTFEPDRHNVDLTIGETVQSSDISGRIWTFGAGRRICPGLHLAENTVSLAIARMLWAFDISREKDENGNEIDIDTAAITQSVAVCPLPFKYVGPVKSEPPLTYETHRCRILPRSAQRADVLRRDWAKTQDLLDDEGNYKKSPL